MHIDYTNRQEAVKKEKRFYTNYSIFAGKVRLVEDGQPPRVIERDDAIEFAKSRGMDLVQIAYNKNDFPHAVCKIYDFNKFKYEQQKREKLAKKQAKANEIATKEVGFSIRIDDNDFNVKCRMIRRFIEDGDFVRVQVRLLRRESGLTDYANDIIDRVMTNIGDIAEQDSGVSRNGQIIGCVVRPKRG